MALGHREGLKAFLPVGRVMGLRGKHNLWLAKIKNRKTWKQKIHNAGSAAKHFYDFGQHNYCKLWLAGAPLECSIPEEKEMCMLLIFILLSFFIWTFY